MDIKQWLSGQYSVRITSADPQLILNNLSQEGLLIRKISWIDNMTLEILVSRRGKQFLQQQCKKGLCDIFIIESFGLPIYYRIIFRRGVLFTGLLIYLLITIYLQNHVIFIHVSGNKEIRTESIIEQAGYGGLVFGCDRKNLRSEQIKNHLLENLPDLRWVGINTSGCVATIYVKERVVPEGEITDYARCASIVASRDGIIRSVTSLKGTQMCQIGQYVTTGQTLISGVKNCRDLLVFTCAQGEVSADTSHTYTVVSPKSSLKRGHHIRSEHLYSITFGKKLINFYNSSGILDASCVKIVNRKRLTLPGGFVLPISICCTSVDYYDSYSNSDNESPQWMLEQCKSYALEQMISGEIVSQINLPFAFEDIFGYRVYYGCREQIGQIKKEELLSIYG